MKKVAGIAALCLGLALAPMAASAHHKRLHPDGRLVVGVGAGVAAGVVVGGPVGAIVGAAVGFVIIHHPFRHHRW